MIRKESAGIDVQEKPATALKPNQPEHPGPPNTLIISCPVF